MAEERLELFSWHNLAFSFDKNVVSLYKDGELALAETVSQEENTYVSTEDNRLLIGRNTFNQKGNYCDYNGFAGAMDELRVFSEAPTLERQRELYENVTKKSGHPACDYAMLAYPANYLSDDIYRMSYHAAPNLNWVSDMCGGFYYNGKYHIFFQKNDTGPYFRSFSWGHMVSDDMVVWKEVQPAIWPSEGSYDDIYTFSGCGFLDAEGKPYLVYTGISDLGELCNLLMARPKDLSDENLTQWEKLDVRLTLPQGYNKQQFRDPYVYTEDGVAYLIAVTQTSGGNPCIVGWKAPLDQVTKWEFCGTVFEMNKNESGIAGGMWELPQMYKLTGAEGTVKYMFTMTPVPEDGIVNNCMYWIWIALSLNRRAGKPGCWIRAMIICAPGPVLWIRFQEKIFPLLWLNV